MVAMYSKLWRRGARYAEHDQSILAWMISSPSKPIVPR